MRTKKTLLVLALAFISYQVNAQFKDSSWLMMHDVSLWYQRDQGIDTFNASGEFGYSPSANIKYSISTGKYKKQHLNFAGLGFFYQFNGSFGLRTKIGTREKAIGATFHFGRKQFIKITEKIYFVPSANVFLGIGKETYRLDQPVVSSPGTEFNVNKFSSGIVVNPFGIAYRVFNNGLIEFNLMQMNIYYEQQDGARKGVNSNIERKKIFVENKFIDGINFSYIHTIKTNRK